MSKTARAAAGFVAGAEYWNRWRPEFERVSWRRLRNSCLRAALRIVRRNGSRRHRAEARELLAQLDQ